jgi:hypothetical protein
MSLHPLAHRWPQALGAVAFWVGFVLLMAPVVPALHAEQALLWHKLVDVLGGKWACIGIGLALLPVSVALLRLGLRRRQAWQDARAAEIMSTLRADAAAPAPPFFLYLRAFETTGRLRVPLFVRLRRGSVAITQGVTDDLESYVGQAVHGVAPLIALGRPGENVGAGRIATADAHWQADIDVLIRRARGVLLVPSDRAGTRWEIDQLQRSGLLPKVIFVMPPRAGSGYDSAARWEAARAALASQGLQLPPYNPRGLLFELAPDGRFLQAEPLLPHAPRATRRAVLRLLDPAPATLSMQRSLRRATRRTWTAAVWGWAETLRQISIYALALAAPWAAPPSADFDRDDSWSIVFARFVAEESIRVGRTREQQALEQDPAFQRWVAANPQPTGTAMPPFQTLGLPHIEPSQQRIWLAARGTMLERMSPGRCADAVAGRLDPDVALSYLPMDAIAPYLEAETAALRAGLAVHEALAATPPHDAARSVAPGLAQQRATLIDELRARLPEADRHRLDAALGPRDGHAGAAADPAAACWLDRTELGDHGDDYALAMRFLALHGSAAAAAAARPPR